MIVTIARKELAGMVRDRRVLILCLALLAMWIMVYLAAMGQQQRLRAERAAIGETTREQWDRQGIKHPHRGAHFGMYAFQPDAPLSAFDPGIQPYVGQAIWMEPHRRNMARFDPAADGGPSIRFGQIVPAFLLISLFPLLFMALAFNLAAQEREQGTLRMLQSMGVSNRAILAGKLLAIVTGLLTVTLPIFALLGADALWHGQTADMLPRVAGVALVYTGYYILSAAIGLAIGAFSRGTRGALFVLIIVWAVAVFAVPRAASAIAQRAVPLPSAQAFWAAIARDYKHGLPGDPDLATQLRDFDAGLLRQYGVTSLKEVPVGVNAARRLQRDAYADKVHAYHFDALWARYTQQQNILRSASLFSPAIPVAAISASLAGTSLAHQRHFEDAAEHYRRYFNTAIDEWDKDNTAGQVSFETQYAADSVWQSVRPFHYTAPPLAFSLRASWLDLLGLAAWAAVAGGALCLAARRWKA
ncbi:ABC-2 family transporter protein [compost metagenome]